MSTSITQSEMDAPIWVYIEVLGKNNNKGNKTFDHTKLQGWQWAIFLKHNGSD